MLGILEFITGTDEISGLQVLPDIRRGEILSPHQRFEQPSRVTMKGGMWERRAEDEEDGADIPSRQVAIKRYLPPHACGLRRHTRLSHFTPIGPETAPEAPAHLGSAIWPH